MGLIADQTKFKVENGWLTRPRNKRFADGILLLDETEGSPFGEDAFFYTFVAMFSALLAALLFGLAGLAFLVFPMLVVMLVAFFGMLFSRLRVYPLPLSRHSKPGKLLLDRWPLTPGDTFHARFSKRARPHPRVTCLRAAVVCAELEYITKHPSGLPLEAARCHWNGKEVYQRMMSLEPQEEAGYYVGHWDLVIPEDGPFGPKHQWRLEVQLLGEDGALEDAVFVLAVQSPSGEMSAGYGGGHHARQLADERLR